jgi:hypothetical protein
MDILTSQLKLIISKIKSSSLNVTPRSREAPPVAPTINSGLRSIEKIRIYNANSVLMKLKTNITRPREIAIVLMVERKGRAMAKIIRKVSTINSGIIN